MPSLVAITVVPKFVSSAPATPKESTVHDPTTRSASRHLNRQPVLGSQPLLDRRSKIIWEHPRRFSQSLIGQSSRVTIEARYLLTLRDGCAVL